MGRTRDAYDYYGRQAELVGNGRQPEWEANARYNMALMLMAGYWDDVDFEAKVEVLTVAIDAAVRAGSERAEAASRRLLGSIVPGRAAIEQLEASLEISRRVGFDASTADALTVLANVTIAENPDDAAAARGFSDEALEIGRTKLGHETRARLHSTRALLEAALGDLEEAWDHALLAMEHDDTVRDLQSDSLVRARVSGQVSYRHLRFANVFAAQSAFDRAFHTMERMRAGIVRSSLDRSGLSPVRTVAAPLRARRDAVLEQINAAQSMLVGRGLDDAERASSLIELERLEAEAIGLLDEMTEGDPEYFAWRRPDIPELAEVQRAVSEKEALLLYAIMPRHRQHRHGPDAMASHLLTITSDRVRAYRIPDQEETQDLIGLFLGSVGSRDGSDRRAAVALHRGLLAQALADFPDEIDRLIVAPNGPLFLLPFGALRADHDSPPLASRFEIGAIPSVTLWLRGRGMRVSPRRASLSIAQADPLAAGIAGEEPVRAGGTLTSGLALHRLPHADAEAHALQRRFGRHSRLFSGPDATESSLKSLDLEDFGTVHFAAHAIVDERHPQRSAVVLAPGDDGEDGLLQPREIAELDLDGRLVVLSGCSTASGSVLGGEGVMSLSRAFFQAGAHAVVSGLWPLRDDEAAAFVDDLALRLSGGSSVGEALASVRRAWIRQGRPTAAWAGLTLHGDPALVPAPRGGFSASTAAAVLVASAVLVLATTLLLRRRIASV